MTDDALVTIQVYPFRSDAELAGVRLDAAGIRSVVRPDDEGGLNPGFFARYGVRLEVRADDVDAARSILSSTDHAVASLFPAEMTEAMVAHARFTYPEEACGLIALDADGVPRMVYCLTNVDRSRYRFTVDPSEHYRAWRHADRNGWDIGGVFHSHPGSAAYPSSTDVAGALDPTWLYVIVGLSTPEDPDVRVFSIAGGVVAALDDPTWRTGADARADR